MTFEDILDEAGGFGRFQKSLVIFFLVPCFTVFPWFSMHVIFITSIPDHWCYVPEIANSSLPLATQKKLIRPASDPRCSMYDVDYSEVLKTHRSHLGPHTPTKKCTEGWVYDNTTYDATSTTKWNMVCQHDYYVALILSTTFMGVLLGASFYSLLSESVGFRPAFLVAASVICVSEVGSALAPNFTLFVLLRIFSGSAVATIHTNAYIIVLDVVSSKMRSRINGISTVSWTAGSSTVPFLAWLTRDWLKLVSINSVCAGALLLYSRYIPESPGWLISNSKYDHAKRIVERISRCNKGTAHEDRHLLERIRSLGPACQLLVEDNKNVSKLDFVRYPAIRKRLALVALCWMLNSMPYFGLMMNTRFLAGDPFLNYFLASVVEVPSHFATWIIVEHLGRRWSTVLALSVTSASCFLPYPFKHHKWVAIVATFLAKAGCSSAYMSLNMHAPELFPAPLKHLGVDMACTAGVCGGIVAPYIVYLHIFGKEVPFLVFSGVMAVAAVCSSFLPETLGTTLPQTVQEAEEGEKGWRYFSCVCFSSTEEEEDTSWEEEILSLPSFSNPEESRIDVSLFPNKSTVL